jgi:hypothetical protein
MLACILLPKMQWRIVLIYLNIYILYLELLLKLMTHIEIICIQHSGSIFGKKSSAHMFFGACVDIIITKQIQMNKSHPNRSSGCDF